MNYLLRCCECKNRIQVVQFFTIHKNWLDEFRLLSTVTELAEVSKHRSQLYH